MGATNTSKKFLDTKHKPRLNRPKNIFSVEAFDLGGLLTAYGISSGGRLTGVTKTRGASDRGAIDRGAIGLSPYAVPASRNFWDP